MSPASSGSQPVIVDLVKQHPFWGLQKAQRAQMVVLKHRAFLIGNQRG